MSGTGAQPRVWTRPQRSMIIGLLSLGAIWLFIRIWLNPIYVSDPQPADPARAAELEDRIDPNTAEWHTLAALPQIGESRARQMIEFREQFVASHSGERAFKSAADLQLVRGIGPGIKAQMEPFLIFTQQSSNAPASAPSR